MENYRLVARWAATVNLDKAIDELSKFKAKYPWAKLEETERQLLKLSGDIPKIINIIKHQEKQNAMHREFVRVNRLADEAIINAVAAKFGIDINDING